MLLAFIRWQREQVVDAATGLTDDQLRWRLVEETAHHAGHADATREMLDGTKMRA